MANNDTTRHVKSVKVACDIIEILQELDDATLSELSNHIERSNATLHTHLATLKQTGYVLQEGNTYKLSPKIITIGEYVKNKMDPYKFGKENVKNLANSTGECAHLVIEHESEEITLYESFGENAVGTEFFLKIREMGLNGIHCTASGKAILAFMPQKKRDKLLDEVGLEKINTNSITDREALEKELKQIRDEKVAFSDEEYIQGLRSVGAPILDQNRNPLAAVSISGPVSRLEDEAFCETFPDLVLDTANTIQVNIQAANYNLSTEF